MTTEIEYGPRYFARVAAMMMNPNSSREELWSVGVWVDRDGRRTHVTDLEDSHLLNVRKFLKDSAERERDSARLYLRGILPEAERRVLSGSDPFGNDWSDPEGVPFFDPDGPDIGIEALLELRSLRSLAERLETGAITLEDMYRRHPIVDHIEFEIRRRNLDRFEKKTPRRLPPPRYELPAPDDD